MEKVKSLGVMLDCSRDAVYTVEALKKYFSLLAKMGYNTVQLYTEDTYEVDGEPYFGYLRGRYSKAELKELDATAKKNGLELIPCIQTLAHLGGITRWAEYRGITDTGDILLAGEERTYELIERMFRTCAECFTSRRINIGMDEAHMVGLGAYLDKHGYKDRFSILSEHLRRVCEIADKYAFKPMMWSDMFFRLVNKGEYYCTESEIPQSVIDLVAENVELIYWDYYSRDKAHYDGMIRAHKQFRNNIVFAGGAMSWIGFAPNNRFGIETCRAAVQSCMENGIEDIFITCWKDDGAECSLYGSLPALFCAAEAVRGNTDEGKIEKKFRRLTGADMRTFLAMDLLNLRGGEDGMNNPSKYMLYSDPFLGIFDRTAEGRSGEEFAEAKKALAAGEKSARFGYIFKTLAALCDVMEIKYTLGIRTRTAYREKDKAGLEFLAGEYKELEKRLAKFYKQFAAQWAQECKPNGFEKHDIRLGGLMQRVRHCRERLRKYCKGELRSLLELDEGILPYGGNVSGNSVCYNNWATTAVIKPNM